jgi:DNA-3-methyladenine glycosylase I
VVDISQQPERALSRCGWVTDDKQYVQYHDYEWGEPVYDDTELFEFLVLEGAQAGLSWLTILRRREGYRQAFLNFQPELVAQFTEDDILRLLSDARIVRNKLKIQSAVRNAKVFLAIQEEHGSFSNYLWQFVGNTPVLNRLITVQDVPTHTQLSDEISADLKKRGMNFVGTTIIYAYLQAVGVVNDHIKSCFKTV